MPRIRLLSDSDAREPTRRAEFVPLRVRNPATGPARYLQPIDVLRIDVHRETRLELLTPAACARVLGCSQSRVLQLIRSGRIEARRVGRQFLILDEVLERLVASERRQLERLQYRAPDFPG